MRKTSFANGEFYHIFNRGTDKRTIFSDKSDLERFTLCMSEFNSTKPIGSLYENTFRDKLGVQDAKLRLVNIIVYCLNSNHFHMILEQKKDNGISKFLGKLAGGYVSYFNIRNKRTGSLFQGPFKAKHIDSNKYLLHLSAYVNLNNKVHRLGVQDAKSSWEEYLEKANKSKKGICKKDIILDQFKNLKEYKDFAENSLKDILERKDLRKEMENLLLE
ncbi:MAG: transposase [bacterium]|nr:transposase [bacterium]